MSANEIHFLDGADHIEEWRGIHIGIYKEPPEPIAEKNRTSGMLTETIMPLCDIYFEGKELWNELPKIEQRYHCHYSAKVVITGDYDTEMGVFSIFESDYNGEPCDCISADEAYLLLCDKIKSMYFNLIMQGGDHSLYYEHYECGCRLGFNLPEATPLLVPFFPLSPDPAFSPRSDPEHPSSNAIIHDGDYWCSIYEQTLAHALKQSGNIHLYEQDKAMEGYDWYQKISKLSMKGYRMRVGNIIQDIGLFEEFTLKDDPDQLQIRLEFVGDDVPYDWHIDTDFLMTRTYVSNAGESKFKTAKIYITKTAKITSYEITHFLRSAMFCPETYYDHYDYNDQLHSFLSEIDNNLRWQRKIFRPCP